MPRHDTRFADPGGRSAPPSGDRLWITMDAFHARLLHTRLGKAAAAAEDRR